MTTGAFLFEAGLAGWGKVPSGGWVVGVRGISTPEALWGLG